MVDGPDSARSTATAELNTPTPPPPSPTRPLVLATASFAVSFAAWGLVGGLASVFTSLYSLTASQTALLVAVPVLLGSLARLPMGMLTDRFGGRLVFTALLGFSSLAAFVVPLTTSYRDPAARGVPDRHGGLVVRRRRRVRVSLDTRRHGKARRWASTDSARWASRSRSSSVLSSRRAGVGRRCSTAPARCCSSGRHATSALARNPAGAARPASAGAMVAVLRRSPTAWLLGAFYFLTFGGFVAFSIYLPTLLRAQFGLAPADAGFRAAGFVVLATLMRPLGGWLADRIGGAQVLSWVFGGVSLFALLLMWPSMVPFTVGALGLRDAAGAGERRGVQARARALSQGDGHGHRSRRRAGRPRRILSSAPARRVSRPAGRHLARLRAPVADGAGAALRERAGLPALRRRMDALAADRRPSGPGARSRGRVGHARDGRPGGPDRRGLAQPAALRRGPGRLHVRHALRHVRHQLPLCDVAEPAADADVLASWLAGVLLAPGARRERRQSRPPCARRVRRERVHLPARAAARPGALADHVGLRARRGDHLPAGVGLDPFRDGSWRPAHVSHVRVRTGRFRISPWSRSSRS